MRIITSDFKKGFVKIKITDPEDLWYLSQIIEPGDLLTAKTTRKVKIGDGEDAKVDKKTLTLIIKAEELTLDLESKVLRINGKVQEAQEFVPAGSYHALSFEPDSEFKLEKKEWFSYQKQKLEEAAQSKHLYLICLLDREESLFALTKKSGYNILLTLKGEVEKKARFSDAKAQNKSSSQGKDFYQEIISQLGEYNSRYLPERIILASPAFYKEDLAKKITDPDLKKKIALATCSDITETALNEVMKSPELKSALQDSRLREEKILMDDLLREINKNELAVYGWKETLNAGAAGAINKLFLSDKFIHQRRKEEKYDEVEALMKTVDSCQGQIHLFSSEQESGKNLDGLGGIAAILKYKVYT
ncbi:mRNA surveillance protein pelota [Candidatus Woesearchaeota archaeon]|nr:mRNA surveillance protein pelota [Candidatus Woesearchaeota archaeon]